MTANAVCALVMSVVLPFYEPGNPFVPSEGLLRGALDSIYDHKFWVAMICGLFTITFTFAPYAFLLRERKRLRLKILRQITDLLGGDLHAHRVTLFHEIGYAHAVARTCFAQMRRLFPSDAPKEDFSLSAPSKPRTPWRLLVGGVKVGRYLIVDERCGPYKKSYAMFLVEEDEPTRCNSILTHVRCTQKAEVVINLPDISSIQLANYSTLEDIPKSYRDNVRRYLELGRSNDLSVLKKYSRKARHFFGAVVRASAEDRPWGVLLIDSVVAKTPFTESVRARLESFTDTLGFVID